MTTQSMARDSAGIVEVEGAGLRYRMEGHGPPCLVVGSSVCYPRVFSQGLREHLRLVFADLRHFADPQQFASADPSFRPERVSPRMDDLRPAALRDLANIGRSYSAGQFPTATAGTLVTLGYLRAAALLAIQTLVLQPDFVTLQRKGAVARR